MFEQILSIPAVTLAGALIGVLNYWGLWLTVKRAIDRRRATLLVPISMFLRLIICMGGMYLLMDHQWERLMAALVGFFLVRTIIVKRVGSWRTAGLAR